MVGVPYVPFPLWMLMTSVVLGPYKVQILSTMEPGGYRAFPELWAYDPTLPKMLAPPLWIVCHIVCVTAVILLEFVLSVMVFRPSNPVIRFVQWLLHCVHCALVLVQFDTLSALTPPWAAACINLGSVATLCYCMPGHWKEVVHAQRDSAYASWCRFVGHPNVYWFVFGLPWWIELGFILAYMPLLSLSLVAWIGVWYFLSKFYFNQAHSHGNF